MILRESVPLQKNNGMDSLNNAVLIQGVTLQDIEVMINRAVDARMEAFYRRVQPKQDALLRRKEAAALLGVSLPTLDRYACIGLLHPKHIGGRVYFSEEEVKSCKSR